MRWELILLVSPGELIEEELHAAFQPNTRCVFAGDASNPALIATDLELFAKSGACAWGSVDCGQHLCNPNQLPAI